MRGLQFGESVVPGPVAEVLVLSPYHGEGVGTYCGCLCIVGQPLEGSNSAVSLRQCSGGLHCKLRVQQGPSGDAPHAESLLHYRS